MFLYGDSSLVTDIMGNAAYTLVDSVTREGVRSMVDSIKSKSMFNKFLENMKRTTDAFLLSIEDVKNFVFTEDVSEQLADILDTINRSDSSQPLSVLMAGPPGAGKTATMRYLVYEIRKKAKNRTKVFVMDGSYLKQFDNATAIQILQVVMRDAITSVRKGNQVIMAIDEIDAIFGIDKANRTMRSDILVTFLFLLNEMNMLCEKEGIKGKFFFFGTTNHVGFMDEAFSRRFTFFLPFGILDDSQKLKLYDIYIKKYTKDQISIDSTVEKMILFLGKSETALMPDDIKNIIRQACVSAYNDNTKLLDGEKILKYFLNVYKKTLYFAGKDAYKVNIIIKDMEAKALQVLGKN